MRRLVVVILAMAALLFAAPACAQSAGELLAGLDLESLYAWSEDQNTGIDAAALLAALVDGEAEWDLAAAGETLKALSLGQLKSALQTLAALVAPALIWAVLHAIGAPGGAASVAGFVCTLAVSAQLIALFHRLEPVASGALGAMASLSEKLYPLLAALLVAAGRTAGSALFTPAAAMAGGLISGVLARWAMPVSASIAALTIAGHLSEKIKLDGLTTLARKGYTWALTGMLTLFTALLSAQGLLAKGYDGASIEAARFAASSLLPVVGGEVADGLDAVVKSASLVRNAVGVTGVLMLAAAIAAPLVTLLMQVLAVRLAAALIEPLSTGPVQKLMDRFGSVLSLLASSVIAGALMVVVLVGAALMVFGG